MDNSLMHHDHEPTQVVEKTASIDMNGLNAVLTLNGRTLMDPSAMGKRSGEAKRKAKLERARIVRESLLNPLPMFSQADIEPLPQTVPEPLKPDTYLLDQRNAVRARMDRLANLMDAETDAQRIDRLASAWSKLAEQERILDGRPLPGSRKPGVEKAPKQTFSEPQ